jgi:type 1 glutamine amidotransferase
MKKLMLCLLPAFLLAACCLITINVSAADSPKKISVLLVTGDDVAPAHNWAEVSQAIKETLLACGKFDVKVCEDAGILDSANLNRYDVVFLHLYNQKTPAPSPGARANLEKFVQGGKGLVVSHLSSASWGDWAEFRKMCGRYWVMGTSGHGPRSVFEAKVVKTDHPITSGMSNFKADDELYAKLQGSGPIDVLVAADSDFSGKTEPLAFTIEYGQGRVFHEAFGHDGKAIKDPNVQKLIQRGCEWAATGRVQ